MKILTGKRVASFEKAARLAFEEAGKEDMSPDIASLFASAMDVDKVHAEGERSIKSAIHSRYGNKARWYGREWFIAVPRLRVETEAIPQLTMTVQPYLVSVGEAEADYDSHSLTLVGAIVKPEVLAMPMTFLWALLSDDLGRFRLVAKDSSFTSWEMPGTKPVELPNEFLSKLSETLKRKSVGMWLEDFGPEGRVVAPQLIGCLLGLQFMGVAQAIPTGQQGWSEEILINALVEGMDYKPAEAKEMFLRAVPNLRVDHTREEALRVVIQQAGKGG